MDRRIMKHEQIGAVEKDLVSQVEKDDTQKYYEFLQRPDSGVLQVYFKLQ